MTTEHKSLIGPQITGETRVEIPQGIRVEEKPERVADDLLEWTRRWNVMLGDSRDAVDFDLALRDRSYRHLLEDKGSKPSQGDLRRVYSHLPKFVERVQGLSPPSEPLKALQLEFLQAKVKAHKVFFERRYFNNKSFLDEHEGEFDSFVRDTQGVSPEIFSADEIERQKQIVAESFKRLGYETFDRDQVVKYRKERSIKNGEEIITQIRSNATAAIDALSRFLGTEVKPHFEAITVNEDKYWLNWASGDRDGFLLKVNLNDRHRIKWTPGKVQEMANHEIAGHFAQMASWAKAIGRRDLLPVLGMTSIHDPEQVTAEGIAQTLHLFVPEIDEMLTDEARFEIEYTALRTMVYNNLHILANSPDYTQESLVEYVQDILPVETRETVRKEIQWRTEDVAMRSYLYAYGRGNVMHRQYAKALNVDGRRELLRLIFSQPITPNQETRFVNLLQSDSRYSAKAA